jgi:hypothetical protein
MTTLIENRRTRLTEQQNNDIENRTIQAEEYFDIINKTNTRLEYLKVFYDNNDIENRTDENDETFEHNIKCISSRNILRPTLKQKILGEIELLSGRILSVNLTLHIVQKRRFLKKNYVMADKWEMKQIRNDYEKIFKRENRRLTKMLRDADKKNDELGDWFFLHIGF